ncbi:MAG: hypothetical protein QOE90_3310 [Thermoplasmata archaeon]|jgi:hypothetical protein|nr:hypothetical protein [Thermoplasmata archaeon]
MRALLLAALLVAPSALALDAFPTESRLGATEARFLVRLPQGGMLHVEADGAAVQVAVAPAEGEPGAFAAAPATFEVDATSVWHGLPGTVALIARRADPARPVTLDVDDGAGGAQLEWPAAPTPARGVPGPGAAAVVGIVVVATTVAQTWQRSRSRRRNPP